MNRGRLLLAFAVSALLGVVLWSLSRDGPGPRSAPRREEAVERVPGPRRPDPERSLPQLTVLLAARPGPASQDAAAALRRALRTDPDARRRAEERLLAPETPRDVRIALAFVLGTLPGSDPVLRQALARYGQDAAVARGVALALGATREPLEDDEVFGLGDRPWGAHGPFGLGITVRRAIDDPETRAVLASCLADGRVAVREAGAIALRHSMASTDARSGFVAALRTEATDDVALVLGEALAAWAGGARAGSGRGEVVAALLARAGDEGLEGFRFRMEDDFRRIALDPTQQATLFRYAQPARPYSVRSFALSVLAASAPEAARPLLEGYVESDDDAAVRDLGARLLGRLPRDDRSIAVLAAATRDAAWNVRYQAVDALARFRDNKTAADALEASTADPDRRVAERARKALR